MRIKERKAAGTRGGMPTIVMKMFLDKCARIRTIGNETASRLAITLHENFVVGRQFDCSDPAKVKKVDTSLH